MLLGDIGDVSDDDDYDYDDDDHDDDQDYDYDYDDDDDVPFFVKENWKKREIADVDFLFLNFDFKSFEGHQKRSLKSI